ncbi:unnamed protein product [Haemonchus placei]|uniref:BAR_3_WASP_bdg domain-containing protein n=1 Tax=Haemonchus placei TaxID=6290 RepID=A0A0N4WTM3_HAEPC|nr:unnamed protein product [Haemonchus placei]
MLWFGPVGTVCRTVLRRCDGMSNFGRENKRDDISVLPKMVASCHEDMKKAVEQIDPIQDTAMVVEQYKFAFSSNELFYFVFHSHCD